MNRTLNIARTFGQGICVGPTSSPQRDPKDVRIEQLERRVRELEARLSDASWEASARHAQATGGWQ